MSLSNEFSNTLNFIIMRHPRPLVSDDYIYGAMENVPLNLSGEKTCRAFEAIAEFVPPDAHVVCSPSPRAQKGLSEVIRRAPSLYWDHKVDPAFLEQDFGDWVEKSKTVFAGDYTFNAYRDDPMNITPPNGESFRDVIDRVKLGYDALVERFKSGDLKTNTVLISAHGGVARAFMAVASDNIYDPAVLQEKVQRLSLSGFSYDGTTGKLQRQYTNLTLDQADRDHLPALNA